MSSLFERRNANIKANSELLGGAVKAGKAVKNVKVAKPKAPPRVKKQPAPRAPQPVRTTRSTRSSARLAGASADTVDGDKADGTHKADDELLALGRNDKPQRTRVRGDVKLEDVAVEGRKWTNDFEQLKDIAKLPKFGADPGVRTFTEDDIKMTSNADLKALRKEMSKLDLYDKWPVQDIKITPSRVYAMAFHSSAQKPMVFAGDKEGNIGFFDASQEPVVAMNNAGAEDDEDEVAPPSIHSFKSHGKTVTSLVFSPTNENAAYSAAYDGSIRMVDMKHSTSVDISKSALEDDLPISRIDIAASSPHLIYFSTNHGTLGCFDVRAHAVQATWELTSAKIGGFSLHPLHAHIVATASLDRTLKIWDIRRMPTGGGDAEGALLGEHGSKLSVSHAAFSSAGHVATSSYDDTIKIHRLPNELIRTWAPDAPAALSDGDMQPAHVVRHNNQTGRWVTILKPSWHASPADGHMKFVIGNMNRFVDVFSADGEQLAQLGGDGITAVPAVACFHPTQNWVAGASASGKLCLWM